MTDNTAAHLSPRPAYRIKVGNKDITGRFQGRLIGLTLTDNSGFEADQLDIELDDSDGKLDLPEKFRVQGFAANQLLLLINQDWKGMKAGSLVGFQIAHGKVGAAHLLFAPGPRQSIDGVAATRGHVLAAIYDNVRALHGDVPPELAKARLRFYRAAQVAFKRVLDLMGMSAPEQM